MTKDEALKLALEALEYASDRVFCENNDDLIALSITAIKQALSAPVQPVAWVEYETGNHTKRPQNCGTGYCSCIECVMEPAVPDAFGTQEGEHPQYVQGWNDCRAETLKMRKP